MRFHGLIGGLVALGMVGGGGAALAHEGDHDGWQRFDAEHERFDEREAARYQWEMARCDGDPRCEWFVTRRENRRRALEHERMEHRRWREYYEHGGSPYRYGHVPPTGGYFRLDGRW
jgi:hypothetical protein